MQQLARTYVLWRGRRWSYFGGCDYFRLASHPAVLKAVRDGLRKFGLNVSASRTTTGNHVLYEKLERALARFFKTESAVLAGNGSAPNLMVAETLAGRCTHALIDERAHGCLVDAAQLLDCPVIRFAHRDAANLAHHIRRLGHIRPIVLTDGMFAHDGSVAPIKSYLAAMPKGGCILVDDAHGAGVLGRHGRGMLEHGGVNSNRVIQTVTLSKAFGVYGGAVLGTKELTDEIKQRSRTFIGTTPLPLPLANAALKSLSILKSNSSMRTRSFRNTEYMKSALRDSGWPIPDFPGPIISIAPANAKEALALRRSLTAARIYPTFIHYPGGPVTGHFRFVVSSEHSRRQLDALISALRVEASH